MRKTKKILNLDARKWLSTLTNRHMLLAISAHYFVKFVHIGIPVNGMRFQLQAHVEQTCQ